MLIAFIFGPPSDMGIALIVIFTVILLICRAVAGDEEEEEGSDWKDRA
jgi:hypothetical protein